MKIERFEDLIAWQKARELTREVYRVTRLGSFTKDYGLCDQIRRASVSVMSNIAEGFGRFHYKENAQFCRISRGSLFELLDDLITSIDEEYINQEDYQEGRDLISHALTLLNGYINYLNRRSNSNTNNE